MQIIDHTEQFIRQVLDKNDRRAYEQVYPELFDHYYKFWSERGMIPDTTSAASVRDSAGFIRSRLSFIMDRFEDSDLDISALNLVLFVGQGTTNGHAFRDAGKFVVWIPVETYTTALLVDVFVIHEICHALHYRSSPGFYFQNRNEKELVSRQLITEGLATALTAEVLATDDLTALWGDFLSAEAAGAWLTECRRHEAKLCRFVRDNFNTSDLALHLFHAFDPEDIFAYRAGYYVGLQVIRHISKKQGLDLRDIMCMESKDLTDMARSALDHLLS